MQKPRFSRIQTTICAAALAFSFQRAPALAETPQQSIKTTVEQLTNTNGIDLFLASAPREPASLVQAVFEHVRTDGKGGFKTIPTDQAKGALTVKEYAKIKEGDCTDTDLYATAIFARAKAQRNLPKDMIIGTIVYSPYAHPDIGHVVTFVSHSSLTPSTSPLAQEVSQKLEGKPITIIDPATETLGNLKYPGKLSYVITEEERNGLFFMEQGDAALRAHNAKLAQALYERAFEFLKNNADASKEIREKLGTFSFNEGIEALQGQNVTNALTAMKKAKRYNTKPLYVAFALHVEGLIAATQTQDSELAKKKFAESNEIISNITGTDAKMARELKANNDQFIQALSQQ